MRGRHRSFTLPDIVHEAQLLELQGAREVNLVAQDLAHYGRDLRDGSSLASLLRTLVAETGIPWIRMLYLYSAGINAELLETMASEPRILSYLDMPIQHAADEVLQRMRRPERRDTIRAKVRLARGIVPEVAIRTTCIVGFPGETDEQFSTLLEFLGEMRFDGVGCFTYSAQEGTRAWEYSDDIPESVKRERLERVTELQRALISERNASLEGTVVTAMVDAESPDGEVFPGCGSQARAWWQAHDIDGVMLLDSALPAGTLLTARVTGQENDHDLRAAVVQVLDSVVPVRSAAPSRRLPLAHASTGAYGR